MADEMGMEMKMDMEVEVERGEGVVAVLLDLVMVDRHHRGRYGIERKSMDHGHELMNWH